MPRKKDNSDAMLQQVDAQLYTLNMIMQQLIASPKNAEIYLQQRISDLTQARQKIYAQKWEESMKQVEQASKVYVQQELVSATPVATDGKKK